MKKHLVIISSFPDRGEIHSAATVGVASYTKNLALAMLEADPELTIEVLAEKIPGYTDYEEGKMQVRRVWQRGNVASLWNLILAISAKRDEQLLLEFEINEFGRAWHTVFFLLGLILVRLLGARLTLVMHQVVGDFRPLESNQWLAGLKNAAKTALYAVIKMASCRVIVFEEELKKYLGGDAKIQVVPHFVAEPEAVSRTEARARLDWRDDKKYLLVFGYIAAYKGIKELLEIWPEETDYQLVIAGGMNPNHADDQLALAYFQQVEALAAAKGAVLTGFVPEEKMADYFVGCDGMIFPYRIFMSSSGPLAWAWSYGRPVLLSPALEAYCQTADLATALSRSGLRAADVIYEPTPAGLRQALDRMQATAGWSQLAAQIRKARSRASVAAATLRVIADASAGRADTTLATA